MKWHTARAISTVAALALAMVLAGQAQADCSGSQRISHDEAGCLEASWDNDVDALSNGRVTATNECASYGTIGLKIELNSCTAIYRTLSTGTEYLIGTQTCDVEAVVCCKDRGDLCNITDVVSANSCVDQFSKSPASETCQNPSALYSPTYSADSDTLCIVTARCEQPDNELDWTGLEVEWLDVPDLHNCDGELRLGAC